MRSDRKWENIKDKQQRVKDFGWQIIRKDVEILEYSNILSPKNKPIRLGAENGKISKELETSKPIGLEDAKTIRSVEIEANQSSNNQSNLSYSSKQTFFHPLKHSNFCFLNKNNTFPANKIQEFNEIHSINRLTKINFVYQNMSDPKSALLNHQQDSRLTSQHPKGDDQHQKIPFIYHIQQKPLRYGFINPHQSIPQQSHDMVNQNLLGEAFEKREKGNEKEEKKTHQDYLQRNEGQVDTLKKVKNLKIEKLKTREMLSKNKIRFHNEPRRKIKKLDSLQTLYLELKTRESQKYEELIIYQQNHNEWEKEQDGNLQQLPTPKRLFQQFENELNLTKQQKLNHSKKEVTNLQVEFKGQNCQQIKQQQVQTLENNQHSKTAVLLFISAIFILLVQIIK